MWMEEKIGTRVNQNRGDEPTTVVDLSGPAPEVIRVGGGDPSRFA
jgi:tRNA A37 threonylcarbamoyladenosine synthetase subunit TsaC/SUA5/YrdC